MKIHVHHIKAHISRSGYTHYRVEICPVVITEAARLMYYLGYLQYVLVEDPQGIGIRQHEPCRIFPHGSLQRFEIYAALFI